MPISFLTEGSETLRPKTSIVPESMLRREHMAEMVVDLPAPLGPRKAKNEPSGTSKDMPLTASTSPYDFTSPHTDTACMPPDLLQRI